MWKTRSKLLFTAGIGLSGVILLQMGMYGGHIAFGWDLNFNVFQICRQLLHAFGIDYLVDGLTWLVALTFAVAGWLAVRQCIATRKAFLRLDSMRNQQMTEQLGARYEKLGSRIWVIDYDKPAAFTMGLLSPKIVLSSRLLSMLDREEEAAVVYHEAYHMLHYDPLKTWLLQMCSSLLFYVPVLRHILEHYKTAREILADNEAINRTGTPAGIGSALLKLLRNPSRGAPNPLMTAVCSSFAETSINYRISRILDPHQALVPKLPRRPVMISLYVLSLLSILFALALI
ncbi:M56 family metallopeptidase [Paenibacillus sp. P96]|uniref:M56 family metallopeptidase n=1 Tax=Paenibacillus zeirhizosphaerae TaxID=2987519 RepID=A0ABT9FN58_9BACL|nr:M56 family metallopeptidase [Paenibacillus sp. P96]MDP4096173.1 M56 family metallopeptidase [Paenibacillus sp. P96]